ncbi:serine/threonine protein kinase [Oscillatoria salina]|uniref:serine/threonine protein kinase n=1 Tax=Oscillatoria salina TaxID=331517 RepID=UPI001CC9529C|nr:serine/threonine-protein kinase [Oscillatoria salina]MBZ8182712.1 serine/threonine protein kinase [Oscillatoria salina IIICB1]
MLETKQIIGARYQLEEQLSNNAGRQTWIAKDLNNSSTVIVKLLAFSPQMQWDEFKLFEREAQVLKQLNHPRIPRYQDYFSLDKEIGGGLCWFGMVQEYIRGKSLQQLLEEGKRFSETQVRAIAIQVLEILRYLHQLNPAVLHRDLKPSNLILGENQQIYLVDFGAVQNSAAVEGVTFTVVGTTGYAPLEQFWGKASPASDLYALGATLIHLLTGTSPANLPQRNLRIQFREIVSIEPKFISWIETLTEPDLEFRFQSALQALEALETGNFANYHLQTITSPFRSKIKLQKSPSQFQIEIPGRGFLIFLDIFTYLLKLLLQIVLGLSLIGAIISIIIFLIIFLVITLSILNGWIAPEALLVIFISILLISLLAWLFKVGNREFNKIAQDLHRKNKNSFLFGDYHFNLTKDKFVIKRCKFNICYCKQQGNTKEINAVKKDEFNSIFFQTRRRKHYFVAKKITQAESNWLIREIEEWLQ